MQPPINQDNYVRINGFNLKTSAQVLDAIGIPVTPTFPVEMSGKIKVSDLLVQDDFIYRLIKKAQLDVMNRLYAQSSREKVRNDNLFENTLIDNLYRNIRAAYYHLQGFIYRYTRIAHHYGVSPGDISMGITVVDEDLPLELEFESFMMRYRTCVELVVKLIALKATRYDPGSNDKKNKYDFKKTLEYVREHPDNPVRVALAEAIEIYEERLDENKSGSL